MKVGINAAWLATQTGGIKTYVRNLVRCLPSVDTGTSYVMYSRELLDDGMLPAGSSMPRLHVDPGRRIARVPFATSLALARAGVDVVHEQIVAPLVFPSRVVVTVHDTLHEHYPDFYPPAELQRMRALTRVTVRRAAVVVTDSEFSKRDIIRLYRLHPDKVAVAYLAADPMFQPIRTPERLEDVRRRYGTGERFILFAGSLKPTKNLKTIIAAFVQLRRADISGHRLVLVGGKAWYMDAIFDAIRASGYDDEIVFTDYICDDDLVALYSAADLFVHPSIFEGFGLPILEAMACGVPVITSNTSAIPEVAGDAALMVDPLDVEGLAHAMAQVLTDDDLRARLAALGLQRAASFSWDETARSVAHAYRRAANTALWSRLRQGKQR